MQHLLAGIDGCSGGWVVALADEDFTSFALQQIASIGHLFSDGNAPSVVAVDMPIGLPERTGPKGRTPERLVRPLLGERQSSVFSIPSRSAVYAGVDPSEPDERKRDPASQRFAWEQLEKIRSEVGASLLLGTAGNHDVDSRRVQPDFDPKSALQSLAPLFPIDVQCYQYADAVYSDRYWSKNFVFVPFPDFDGTLLIINSAAFHGFASERKAPPEHIRGKFKSAYAGGNQNCGRYIANTLECRFGPSPSNENSICR